MTERYSLKRRLIILLLFITFFACQKEQLFEHAKPTTTDDGIKSGYFKPNNIDSTRLIDYLKKLPNEKEHKLGSVLLMKNNELIFENYWNGYNKDKLHDLRSATKSITALLVGIAIDKGFIKNEYEHIQSYLEDYKGQLSGKNIRIVDLLNMNSGLDCNDWLATSPGNEEKMYSKKDWVNFILNQKQFNPKPNNAVYCTGGVVVLGYIVQKASGLKFDDFAKKYLFSPLHIEKYTWEYFDKKSKVDAGGHLCLRPRDLLKIGQLVMNAGTYQKSQIVSEAWIKKCESREINFKNGDPYGYLWWKNSLKRNEDTINYHFMSGNGGQIVAVLPSVQIVAVFTGQKYNSDDAFDLVKYILNAAVL
jgi:CubicO group peptidase (beta-lactamase class C family)